MQLKVLWIKCLEPQRSSGDQVKRFNIICDVVNHLISACCCGSSWTGNSIYLSSTLNITKAALSSCLFPPASMKTWSHAVLFMALRNTLISPPSQCDWTPHRTLEPSVRCLLGNGINLQTSARHKEKPLWVGIFCVFRRIFLPRASIWSVLFLRRTHLVSLISIFEL